MHFWNSVSVVESNLTDRIPFLSLSLCLYSLSPMIFRYQENVNKLHRLLNDQPQTALERAVWWIEYVARNGGTKPLHVRHLSWFEYLMLDVLIVVGVLASLACALIAYAIVRAVRYSKSLPMEMVTRGSRKCKMM